MELCFASVSALCCKKAFLTIGAPAKAGEATRLISWQSSLSLLACMSRQTCAFLVMPSPSNGSASSRHLLAVFPPPSHSKVIVAPLFELLTAHFTKESVHPGGAGRRLGVDGAVLQAAARGTHALLKYRKVLFQCHVSACSTLETGRCSPERGWPAAWAPRPMLLGCCTRRPMLRSGARRP